jgi:hypothetical protein
LRLPLGWRLAFYWLEGSNRAEIEEKQAGEQSITG